MSSARSPAASVQPLGTRADVGEGEAARARDAAGAVGQTGELEDVGVPCRQLHHDRPMTTDQEWHVGLRGPDAEVVDGQLVELTVEARRSVVEQRA